MINKLHIVASSVGGIYKTPIAQLIAALLTKKQEKFKYYSTGGSAGWPDQINLNTYENPIGLDRAFDHALVDKLGSAVLDISPQSYRPLLGYLEAANSSEKEYIATGLAESLIIHVPVDTTRPGSLESLENICDLSKRSAVVVWCVNPEQRVQILEILKAGRRRNVLGVIICDLTDRGTLAIADALIQSTQQYHLPEASFDNVNLRQEDDRTLKTIRLNKFTADLLADFDKVMPKEPFFTFKKFNDTYGPFLSFASFTMLIILLGSVLYKSSTARIDAKYAAKSCDIYGEPLKELTQQQP